MIINDLWEYLAERGILLSKTEDDVPSTSKHNRRNNVYVSKDGENVRFWKRDGGNIYKSKPLKEDESLRSLMRKKVFGQAPKKK